MQTEQALPATNPTWFLIASDGDMVLRVSDTLSLGESQCGELVINPKRAERLLQLRILGDSLRLRVLSLDHCLSEDNLRSVGQLLFDETPTIQLNLPHNSLIASPNFIAGSRLSVDREVDVLPTAPAVALQRLAEPATLIDLPTEAYDQGPLPDDIIELIDRPGEDFEKLLRGLEPDVPDETLSEPLSNDVSMEAPTAAGGPDTAEPEAVQQAKVAAARPARGERLQPQAAARSRRWRTTTRLLLATAAAAAAVLMPIYLADPKLLLRPTEEPPVDGTALDSVFVTREAPSPTLVTAESAAAPEGAAPDRAAPESIERPDLTALPGTAATMAQPAQSMPDPQQALVVAALLEEARTLYDGNAIVSPTERNAVKTLIAALTIDPQSEQGLALMYLCATTLLDQARSAYAAGDYFLARNLVEEVLGFHPEFEEAQALLLFWSAAETGAPDRRDG